MWENGRHQQNGADYKVFGNALPCRKIGPKRVMYADISIFLAHISLFKLFPFARIPFEQTVSKLSISMNSNPEVVDFPKRYVPSQKTRAIIRIKMIMKVLWRFIKCRIGRYIFFWSFVIFIGQEVRGRCDFSVRRNIN